MWPDPSELAVRLALGLADPVSDLLGDAAGKLWWPYVLAGLAIAWWLARRRGGTQAFLRALLDRQVWTSRSARNDYLILFINPVLQVTLLSVLVLEYRPIAAWVAGGLGWLGVRGEASDGTALALGLLLTAALFVADDLARWLTHYLQHRVPALWEFHKVHHSAEVLNLLTLQRHHPVDPLLTTAAIGIVTALVNGLFIGLWGEHLTVLTVAGANVFRVAANLLGGVLRHSPFWWSFGASLERWLVSPAMHHIHHSSDPAHWDTNFGTALSVWDRLAGTLYLPGPQPVTDFGIGAETAAFRTIGAIYLRPLARVARMLAGAAGPEPPEPAPPNRS